MSVPVMELARSHRPDVYLLTSDDIPFVQDGLRDGGHIRARMTARFREELDKFDVPGGLVELDSSVNPKHSTSSPPHSVRNGSLHRPVIDRIKLRARSVRE